MSRKRSHISAQAIGKGNLSMEIDEGEINDNGTLIYEGIGPGVEIIDSR